MRRLDTLDLRRRLACGLTAVLLVAMAGAGCGDDDNGSPPPSPGGAENGTTTLDTTPAALPDLVFGNVSVMPSGPLVPPGQVQISATVTNTGAARYGRTIAVQAPGNHMGFITDGLDPGASDVAVIDFPVVSPNATYTFSLVIDPDDIIAEESESNNESVTITIKTSF